MIRELAQYRQILAEYGDAVHRIARSLLHDERDAEEAVQDAFLVIYQGLKSFQGNSTIPTWIYTITLNACRNRRRIKVSKEDYFELLDDQVAVANISDSSINPEEIYGHKEVRDHVARSIRSLPQAEAQAITLFYLEELDYKEIGEAMGVPISSVATILHRGRTHLHYLMLREKKEKSQ